MLICSSIAGSALPVSFPEDMIFSIALNAALKLPVVGLSLNLAITASRKSFGIATSNPASSSLTDIFNWPNEV